MVFTAISVNIRRIHLKNDNNLDITPTKIICVVVFEKIAKMKDQYLKENQIHFYRIAA